MTEHTAPWERVDWADVDRRARVREPLFVLVLVAVAVGWAGVSDRLVGVAGAAKWTIVAIYVLLFVAFLVAQRIHPSLRTRAADGHRLEYALREHVDPGPGLREKVDRQAVALAGVVWFRWWLVLLLPAGLLIGAPWERTATVLPSAVLLVAGAIAWALFLRRMFGAALRWLADPPGPPREMPGLPRWRRWISGWRFLVLLLCLLVATTAAAVVLALMGE